MTRYYDPVIHRFINADGSFQAGGGLLDTNMGAYCGNNPVSNIDPNGTCYINGRWQVMGRVPGADYYCYKCGGCDPAVYPNAPKRSYSPKSNIGDDTAGLRSTTSVNTEISSNTPFIGTYSGTTNVISSNSSGAKDVVYYYENINGNHNVGAEVHLGDFNFQINLGLHDTGINIGWGERYVGANIAWDGLQARVESGTSKDGTTAYSGAYIDGWGLFIIGAAALGFPELAAEYLGKSPA